MSKPLEAPQSLRSTDTKPSSLSYDLGSCTVVDKRATEEACSELREHVKTGLVSKSRYAETDADARVEMTITYYRDLSGWIRILVGALSGKEGMDVDVEISDRETGEKLGSANISNYHYTAGNSTESSMVASVGSKVVAFLTGE